jgi:hypothetical protein
MQSDWHVQELKLVSTAASLTERSMRFQLYGITELNRQGYFLGHEITK